MDNQTHKLIQLGKEVDALLVSDLGKYLLEKAEADRRKAMAALGDADPTDVQTIAKIQEDYNTPNKVMKWLFAAKEEGAARLLEAEMMEDAQQNRTGNIR